MTKTIWRSSTNTFRAGLIETLFLFQVPLASGRRQGKLRRGWHGQFGKVQICTFPAAPLPPLLFADRRKRPRKLREEQNPQRRADARAPVRSMEKKELEDLRDRVLCAAVLEQAGFAVDVKESTRKAIKYRRGAEIVIVIHEGRGWFDPLSDAKGDVFSLAAHLEGVSFVEALDQVAALVGFVAKEPMWTRSVRDPAPAEAMPERWAKRRKPWRGSMTWRYLRDERCLPEAIIRDAIRRNLLREGPHGSMWAAHIDDYGAVTGWEERGPDWRGFSTGGSKVLFRFGPPGTLRLCVTESAIDAMSLAAFEGSREGSLYLSTGGGWSPATEAAVRVLAARPGAELIAATDANSQGETFADRLRDIAENAGCDWFRLTPPAEDWNDALCAREKEKKEREKEGRKGLPHARRPRQG